MRTGGRAAAADGRVGGGRRVLLAAAGLLAVGAVLLLVWPDGAAAQAPVDVNRTRDALDLSRLYREVAERTWKPRAYMVGLAMFGALTLTEVAHTLYVWQNDKFASIQGLVSEMGWKFAAAGIVFILFATPLTGVYLLEDGVEMFESLGTLVGGGTTTVMNPLDILDAADDLSWQILGANFVLPQPRTPQPNEGVWAAMARHLDNLSAAPLYFHYFLVHLVASVVAVLIVQVAFFSISCQLLLVRISSTVLFAVSPIFMSFGAYRVLAGVTESFLRYALEVAVRLFLLQLMIGVGFSLLPVWQQVVAGWSYSHPVTGWVSNVGLVLPPSFFLMIGSVAFWGIMAWAVPSIFSKRVAASFSIGLSAAVQQAGGGGDG